LDPLKWRITICVTAAVMKLPSIARVFSSVVRRSPI
jgi:hypothetical protein